MTQTLEVKALMGPQERQKLLRLAQDVPPTHEIVELGSWAGGSAVCLCLGASRGNGAHVTCIDIWEDWIDPPEDQYPALADEAFQMFTELVDQTNVTPLKAASLDVAKMWTRPIGLLFIDALHTYEAALADYEAWSPHIPPGGVLAIHDYVKDPPPELWWTEGPTRAVDEQVIPSGLWEPMGVTEWLWAGRRR